MGYPGGMAVVQIPPGFAGEPELRSLMLPAAAAEYMPSKLSGHRKFPVKSVRIICIVP